MKQRASTIWIGIQNIGAMLYCDVTNELRALFCHLGTLITLDFIFYPIPPYTYPVSIGTGWQICTVRYVRSLI